MFDAPWMILDVALAGACGALAVCFLADGLRRKDHPLLECALACSLQAMRLILLMASPGSGPTERLAHILLVGAFVLMGRVFLATHAPRLHPRLWPVLLVGLVPGLLASVVGLHTPWAIRLVTVIDHGVYTLTSLAGLRALGLAAQAGEAGARRTLVITSVAMTLFVAQALAGLLFHTELPLSDLGLVMLLGLLGVLRMWAASRQLLQDLLALLDEIRAWRSLLPGPSWRPGETPVLLSERLGEGWHLNGSHRIHGLDGVAYTLHRTPLPFGGEVGWAEPDPIAPADMEGPFLRGWLVGVGVDDEDAQDRLWSWLVTWGAQVTYMPTVPPREGPYPSLLIWGREPSILAVWRENDLARRRCRWVQLGGAETEGPHLQVPMDVDRDTLMEGLKTLMSLRREP